MAPLTNTTAIASVGSMFSQQLLDRLTPELVHGIGAESRPLRARSGNSIKIRRIESLSAATTPLVEGVTPTGSVADDTVLTSTIYQLADFITGTDIKDATDESALVSELIDVLGEQAGNSVDQSRRDVMVSGTYFLRSLTSSTYDTSSARTAVAFPINKETLRAAVGQLEAYNVKKFKSLIKAGSGIGSSPIPESYIMIVHPHVVQDLRTLITETNGWIPVHKYAAMTDLMPGEVGAFADGLRVVATTNAKIWLGAGATATTYRNSGTVQNVYACLVYGKGFIVNTELDGGVKTFYKPIGSGGTTDPVDQRFTVGWKIDMVPTITNDYCGVRIECLASK